VNLKPGSRFELEWWRVDGPQPLKVSDSEPGADLSMRMKLYIQSLLIPESLL